MGELQPPCCHCYKCRAAVAPWQQFCCPAALRAQLLQPMILTIPNRCCRTLQFYACRCRLYRVVNWKLCRVPDDGPPLNRQCQERWPPGWEPAAAAGTPPCETAADGASAAGAAAPADMQRAGTDPAAMAAAKGASSGGSGSQGSTRKVRTERDVFELLGLPYREPYQRNCP